jgi:hypothetical protein
MLGNGVRAFEGSQLTISGGSIGDDFSAFESVVTVSGGNFGTAFRGSADDGTKLAFLGGEFLLNGAAPSEPVVTLAGEDILTGTLGDGTPFIFSPLAGDVLGGVMLQSVATPPIDTTPITVDRDNAPRGLREGQTLSLQEGGRLVDHFAAVNATLHITGGGPVNGLEVAGSQVAISGGTIGRFFRAYAGSQVTVSGGQVGDNFEVFGSQATISAGAVGSRFRAVDESRVTISGGEVGFRFEAADGSEVTITGGIVSSDASVASNAHVAISGGVVGSGYRAFSGGRVTISGGVVGDGFSARRGSQVAISGGSLGRGFVAQGGSAVTISGGEFLLNGAPPAGSTITLSGADVLTGTLEDGTPFVFSPLASDELNGIMLVGAELPPIDTVPILVNSLDAPRGLRVGQSLTLDHGGVLPNDFAAVHGTLHIIGGVLGNRAEVSGSQVTITGGTVGSELSLFDGSHVTLSGGSVGGSFRANRGSKVDLYGTEFTLNGSEISELTLGETRAISTRNVELAGVFADETPFSFQLNSDVSSAEFFSPNATLTVTLVSLLEGDYNSNGRVEQADLDLVLLNWGNELSSPYAASWINDIPSGPIDQEELDGVLLQWGNTVEELVPASVPEPPTLLLALALACLSCCFRRSRLRSS